MKIAVVAPTSIPARRANTVQVMKMTQALMASGHQVRLAAPGGPPVAWDELAHHYGLAERFPVDWLPVFPQGRSYDYAWRALFWARRWGAELLYTRLPQCAALSSWMGFPVIYEIHDLPHGALSPRLFRVFMRGRGARRLVVITQALKSDLEKHLGVSLAPPFAIVAPDGVDLSRYREVPAPHEARTKLHANRILDLAPEEFVAGYTGHFYTGRGIHMILELAQRMPAIKFLLAGGEPEAVGNLQQQLMKKSITNVILVGFVPNAELPLYQAACDVLLMPYQRRVAASSGGDIARYLSPMKLFEYLACGRPVLCSDLPVLREVLNEELAVLLPPDDPAMWQAALDDLSGDPLKRDRLGALSRQAAAQYTWERRAAQILREV